MLITTMNTIYYNLDNHKDNRIIAEMFDIKMKKIFNKKLKGRPSYELEDSYLYEFYEIVNKEFWPSIFINGYVYHIKLQQKMLFGKNNRRILISYFMLPYDFSVHHYIN